MSAGVGFVVVTALLVLLPVVAVWVAGRWRDPPREKWGPSDKDRRLADGDLGLAEFRIRREFGLRDESRWQSVDRAVRRGEAAPEEDLRAAAAALARAIITAVDSQPKQWAAPSWARIPLLVLFVGWLGVILVFKTELGVVWLIYGLGFFLTRHRWSPALRRARAESALAANAAVAR
jgi:hypothetical protein